MATVTARIAIDSFTTVVNGERRWILRGRTYPSDDPVVIARSTLFRPVAAFNPDNEEAVDIAEPPKPKRRYRRKK
jgi:hypothetical protein